MITKLSHATMYVLDQDEALNFYTEKLGFKVCTDVTMEGFRWLTVSAPNQAELEIVLMAVQSGPSLDEESAAQLKSFVEKGLMGAGVFATDDCHATYEALKEKGVEFISPPQERPYGVEAVFKDNSGNWFSLTQQKM